MSESVLRDAINFLFSAGISAYANHLFTKDSIAGATKRVFFGFLAIVFIVSISVSYFFNTYIVPLGWEDVREFHIVFKGALYENIASDTIRFPFGVKFAVNLEKNHFFLKFDKKVSEIKIEFSPGKKTYSLNLSRSSDERITVNE